MTAFNSRDGGFFLTTVGRVQTPTLSIMVEREEQIRKHVSRDYWEVRATFAVDAGEYEGKWFDPAWKKNPDDAELRSDRLWNEADALAIAEAVQGEPASVTEEAKPSTQAAPLLYDLTSLQREANSRFGFSARTTLSIAQALYEKHKVLTYPRTDSRALPEDYVAVARQTIEMIAKETLPGPLRPLAVHAKTALKEPTSSRRRRSSTTPRSRTTSRSSRPCCRRRACRRSRPSSTTWSPSASSPSSSRPPSSW